MKRFTTVVSCLAAISMLASGGCQSSPQRFETPEDAVAALRTAAEAQDREAVKAILGPRTDELRSPDPRQDAQDLEMFRHELLQATEVVRNEDGSATVLVGDVRWPFAVPLIVDDGRWRFDTDAGIEELGNRRIGRNELRTIAACLTIIEAQAEYYAADRDGDGVLEYADRMMSSPGKQDGLYWPSPGGIDPSPIGPLLARAATQTDEQGERLPFNGYLYRLLLRQAAAAPGGAAEYSVGGDLSGGWAIVAWPDEYDVTGVMSFLTSHDGVIYEKDLGPDSDAAARAIVEFDPSDWRALSH